MISKWDSTGKCHSTQTLKNPRRRYYSPEKTQIQLIHYSTFCMDLMNKVNQLDEHFSYLSDDNK